MEPGGNKPGPPRSLAWEHGDPATASVCKGSVRPLWKSMGNYQRVCTSRATMHAGSVLSSLWPPCRTSRATMHALVLGCLLSGHFVAHPEPQCMLWFWDVFCLVIFPSVSKVASSSSSSRFAVLAPSAQSMPTMMSMCLQKSRLAQGCGDFVFRGELSSKG